MYTKIFAPVFFSSLSPPLSGKLSTGRIPMFQNISPFKHENVWANSRRGVTDWRKIDGGQNIREYSRNKIMLICSLRCDLSSYGLYNTNKQTVNVDIKIKESKIILCTQVKTLKSRDF